MYIDELQRYISKKLPSVIEDELYLGEVDSVDVTKGSSSTNSSLVIKFILGAYNFNYNVVLTDDSFKMVGYVNDKPKLKYDASNDYTLSHNATVDGDAIIKVIEYHLLTFFGKTVTDEYTDLKFNDKVVIMEKKMVRSKKVKLVLEKKIVDNVETKDMELALQDMYMFFSDKPYTSRDEHEYTETQNEELYILDVIDKMLKMDEFTEFFEKGFNDSIFINTNDTALIIDIILDKMADRYGFKKDRFKEVYSTYRTPQERKAVENNINTKYTKLLSLAYGKE